MTNQPNAAPEPERETTSEKPSEPQSAPAEDFWASAAAPTPPAPTSSSPTSSQPTSSEPTDSEQLADVSTSTAASVTKRGRPLFGTIFWGLVLLAFAAFMVVWTLQPGSPDPTLWLLGGVIVVGLLLVVAGIAAASRRAG